MKFCRIFILVLVLSLHAAADTKKVSDFKEVGGEDSDAGEVSKAEAQSEKENKVGRPSLKENEEVMSGTVNVIRKIDMTEVFFKDLKESYFIPSGSKNYSIYKAMEQSQKKGTKISFKVNTKSRRIVDLSEAPTPDKAPASTTESTDASKGSK